MRAAKPWIVIALTGVLSVAFVLFVIQRNQSYDDSIRVTKEWARLADFPKDANIANIEIKGSMFTREFILTFTASRNSIEDWLSKSPGTNSVTPTQDGTVRTFRIQPGGGAQFAQVKVHDQTNTVTIRTYWS